MIENKILKIIKDVIFFFYVYHVSSVFTYNYIIYIYKTFTQNLRTAKPFSHCTWRTQGLCSFSFCFVLYLFLICWAMNFTQLYLSGKEKNLGFVVFQFGEKVDHCVVIFATNVEVPKPKKDVLLLWISATDFNLPNL